MNSGNHIGIFGTGASGVLVKYCLSNYFDKKVVCFYDNLYEGTSFEGVPVKKNYRRGDNAEIDYIIIAGGLDATKQISKQLDENDWTKNKDYFSIHLRDYFPSDINDYYMSALDKMIDFMNFNGKKVLEVGCGDGRVIKAISTLYQPEEAIGTDLALRTEEIKGNNWKLEEGDVNTLSYPDDTFDFIFSLASFEHIHKLDIALGNIKRMLKPNGLLYAQWGPIWTGCYGHHCHYWSQPDVDLLPPWAHLYMDRIEMLEYVKKKRNLETAKAACDFVFSDPILNRYSRSDIYSFINSCGMQVMQMRDMVSFTGGSKAKYDGITSKQVFNILLEKSNEAELGTTCMEIVLRKIDSNALLKEEG